MDGGKKKPQAKCSLIKPLLTILCAVNVTEVHPPFNITWRKIWCFSILFFRNRLVLLPPSARKKLQVKMIPSGWQSSVYRTVSQSWCALVLTIVKTQLPPQFWCHGSTFFNKKISAQPINRHPSINALEFHWHVKDLHFFRKKMYKYRTLWNSKTTVQKHLKGNKPKSTYVFASSLVAYVTLTTAVSVSVLTRKEAKTTLS